MKLPIPIYENYKDYKPPRYVMPATAKLLSTLPASYLSGLQSIVLTNSTAIGKGKTQRVKGRKFHRQDCRGFYHYKTGREQPWIEIVVDNIVDNRGISGFFMRVPFVRNTAIGSTLFHEVGHHLDQTIGAPARSGEAAAEAWAGRLLKS